MRQNGDKLLQSLFGSEDQRIFRPGGSLDMAARMCVGEEGVEGALRGAADDDARYQVGWWNELTMCLQAICRARGLKVSGNKAELIARLC